MKRLITICVVMTMILAVSGTAQADLSWQTTPVLGINSSYDGDVHIDNGGTPWANIPHDVLDGVIGQPTSITTFFVGQEVHSGSGIYMENDVTYDYTANFVHLTDATRNVLNSGTVLLSDYGNYTFWMNWNSPTAGADGFGIPSLTAADIGNWQYIETWTGTGSNITHTTDFTVVPVPGAVLLGILGLSVAGIKLRKHA